MNRKSCGVLFSLLLVAGAIFFVFKSPTTEKNHDQASTPSPAPAFPNKENQTEPIPEKRAVSSQDVPLSQQPAIPSSAVKSGKYSIQNSQTPPSLDDTRARQFEYLKKNSTGFRFQSSDQKYVVMKLRASREKSSGGSDQQLGHEVFPIETEVAQRVLVDEETYPVVFNESNGKVGFLTGVILLQTQQGEEISKIVSRYPVQMQMYDASIGLATLRVRQGEGLFEVYNQIKQNERVSSISVEVLDSYKGI